MRQFTILMNNATKALTVTNRINLHQHESLADKLCFLIEFAYSEEINLSEFNVVLEWLDPCNVAHVDILEKEEEPYKEKYFRYFLPVTSPLNRYAGDIEAKLVFTKVDYEVEKRYKLESNTIVIPIMSIKDFFAVLPDESFDGINDKIDQLQALVDQLSEEAELYNTIKADNHRINEDGQLVLTSNGLDVGNPVDVATIEIPDGDDDSEDGILDITGKYEDIIL